MNKCGILRARSPSTWRSSASSPAPRLGRADAAGSRSGPPASSTASATSGATATSRPRTTARNITRLRPVDRRRGAAQQPPRLSDVGQVLDALVRVRPRLDVPADPRSRWASRRSASAPPKVKLDPTKFEIDAATLQAVIAHRYDVLANYAKHMKRTSTHRDREAARQGPSTARAAAGAAPLAASRRRRGPRRASRRASTTPSRRAPR